jgi:hypothetical protein
LGFIFIYEKIGTGLAYVNTSYLLETLKMLKTNLSIACLFTLFATPLLADSKIGINYGVGTQYSTNSSKQGQTGGFEFQADYDAYFAFSSKIDSFVIENAAGGKDLFGKAAFGLQASTGDKYRLKAYAELGIIRFFSAYEDYVSAQSGQYARVGFRAFPNPKLAIEAAYTAERVKGTADTNLYTVKGYTPITSEISVGLYTEWEKQSENDAVGLLYIQHF